MAETDIELETGFMNERDDGMLKIDGRGVLVEVAKLLLMQRRWIRWDLSAVRPSPLWLFHDL